MPCFQISWHAGSFFPFPYTKIPLTIFSSLKKHGLEVEFSFYLGLLRGCGKLFSMYLEQSLKKTKITGNPTSNGKGGFWGSHRSAWSAVFGYQAHFNTQVMLGTLIVPTLPKEWQFFDWHFSQRKIHNGRGKIVIAEKGIDSWDWNSLSYFSMKKTWR